jgi:hypothetical protein
VRTPSRCSCRFSSAGVRLHDVVGYLVLRSSANLRRCTGVLQLLNRCRCSLTPSCPAVLLLPCFWVCCCGVSCGPAARCLVAPACATTWTGACPSTSAQHLSGEPHRAVECAALARHAVAVLIIVALRSCCVKGCIQHELMSATIMQANLLWGETVHAQGAICTCSALPVKCTSERHQPQTKSSS